MDINSFTFNGIVLLMLGAALAYLRSVPHALLRLARSQFTIVVDVTERDVFYDWVANWVSSQPSFEGCRRLSASAQRKSEDKYEDLPSDSERRSWQVKVTPAEGEHFFKWRGCRVWMHKDREKLKGSGVFLGFFESVQLVFLTRDRRVVEEFLNEVRRFNIPDNDEQLAIYANQYASWKLLSLVSPRSADTVVLDGDMMQSLVDDMEWFFASKSWYHEHSIPYRRGYLLHGPPGNGKSSSVRALASRFGRDVYILRTGRDLDDANFMDLLADLPEGAILLIEDVEQIFSEDGEDKLTRSGFLNTLDGISAATGRVVFMTTNFVERLDAAVIRPGRADVSVLVDFPTKSQANAYLGRFFDADDADGVFSATLPTNGRVSMSDLQAEVIRRQSRCVVR